MTTLALEGAALEQTPPNSWDVMPVPNDFAVTVTSESRGHQTSFRTIEASWDNEGKVSVELGISGQLATFDEIDRPDHWGEDVRPIEEQQAEYRLGLDGILRSVMAMPIEAIEIEEQTGVVAAALLDLRVPDGWRRLVRRDGWSETEVIDVRKAAAEGASISIRYEENPSRALTPEIGGLAVAQLREN
jgi:hypothetical protein